MDKSPTTFIFHHPKFIFRNPDNFIIFFEERSAQIYFSRVGDTLISLDRAPFGSFIIHPEIATADIRSCVDKITSWSKANGITTLMVKSFPESYDPTHNKLIKQELLASGFDVLYEDITQVIHITSEGKLNLNTHKKRRVRKAEVSGFTFRELTLNHLKDSYALIVESRKNKSYPVTMSFEDLQHMFTQFPNDYFLFGVFDKDRLIAASVCIKVNPEILYCFYIGDDLDYRKFSPVTLLVNGIYDFCRDHYFKILDLGISTDKGKLNKGLYTFKKSFGSIDSFKLTFLKQL